MTFVYFVHKI